MNLIVLSVLALSLPALCAGQAVPPQYEFAGFKSPLEGHSLHRPLLDVVIAAIPGSSNEAYAYEAGTGTLFRLDYTTFRLSEIKVSLPIAGGGDLFSLAVDKEGAVYVPDFDSNRILRILPNGTATVFAGGGPGTTSSGDGGVATQATLDGPRATAIDPAGNVYIAENLFVRKVDPQGRISRFAGCGGGCGTGNAAINRQIRPRGLAIDRRGNVYLTTDGFDQLMVINPAGMAVSIPQRQDPALPGVISQFASPSSGTLCGLAVAPDGALWITDAIRRVIWKVGTNGLWSVAVGRTVYNKDPVTGTESVVAAYYGNGPLSGQEHFGGPTSIALDSSGRLLISDRRNSALRLFTPNESLITVAGQRRCCYQEEFIPATEATIEAPRGLASDSNGNIYVADPYAGRVRKIDAFGRISTILGNGTLNARVGVQGTETGAQPYGVAVDSKGNIYVAEPGLKMVRRVTPSGLVESIAGPASGTFPLDLPLDPGSGAVAVGPGDAAFYLAECSVNRWLDGNTEVLLQNACVPAGDQPSRPKVLAVDPNGAVYLATERYQNLRVLRNGSLQTLGDVFPFGNLAFPLGLHFGQDSLLYVVDYFPDSLTGNYNLAYALTATGKQIPISYDYFLIEFKEITPNILEIVGSSKMQDPFPTGILLGITTDITGRVIIGRNSPPGLLIYPKVQGAN
jgi:streptogramin lyase